MTGPFGNTAAKFWAARFSVTPVRGKAAFVPGWQHHLNGPPKAATCQSLILSHSEENLGVLTGGPILENKWRLIAVDGDDDELVRVIEAIVGTTPCSKVGKKGRTDFLRYSADWKLKSTQIRDAKGKGKVDILGPGKMTVVPPSIHPETRKPYRWLGKSLLEVDRDELPILDEHKLRTLNTVIGSKHIATLLSGETTHDAGVGLAAQLVVNANTDGEIDAIFRGLLPSSYQGNSLSELPGWVASARRKFQQKSWPLGAQYDPGDAGPIALGRDGDEFYFRCQQTGELAKRTAKQLCSLPDLLSLAQFDHWLEHFPRSAGKNSPPVVDVSSAGNALIQTCTVKGYLNPGHIRGFGVWEEAGRIIANTGESLIESKKYIYSHPKEAQLPSAPTVPMDLVLEFFRSANWDNPSSPELLLGWTFASFISGALAWRAHVAVTGAAASGKSTQLRGIGHLLEPFAIVLEGISTESHLLK